jgi:hypothetical protein
MYLSTGTSGGGKKPPLKPPTKTGGLPDKPDDYDHDGRRSDLSKQIMYSKQRPNKISDKTIPDRDDRFINDKSKNVKGPMTSNTEYTKKSRIKNPDDIKLPKRNMTADDWNKETGNGY